MVGIGRNEPLKAFLLYIVLILVTPIPPYLRLTLTAETLLHIKTYAIQWHNSQYINGL